MLTPRFVLTQTDDFVEFSLQCLLIKAQEVEIDVDGSEFKFFAHPYFLRLSLPGRLIEDGRERSSYDIDKGIVSLKIPKETAGEHFADLDMLTKLMDIRGGPADAKSAAEAAASASGPAAVLAALGARAAPQSARAPLIQEQDAPSALDMQPNDQDGEEEEIDWSFPQMLPPEPLEGLNGAKYGFNNQYSGYAQTLYQVATEVLDVVDLDTSTPESRRAGRIAFEDEKFDDDYYISDFLNDEEIQRLIRFKPESWRALREIQAQSAPEAGQEKPQGAPFHPFLEFSAQEQDQLRKLSNRRYLIDPPMEHALYLGLVDILFGHCYNLRTTEGEPTVESAWTICKLSGTLSCFDTFSDLQDVVTCCLRRSLAYPLYRHFELSARVLEDVVILLKLGRRAVLKALLQIKRLLDRDEVTFVLDRVWITDYCVWIQQASDKRLRSLASQLHRFEATREMVGWPLSELEALASEDMREKQDPFDDDVAMD
ncbi:hypothetical protein HK105_205307 [Polyrhizophydium stewartii]|uniref:CS domain-containing protein n=1 Tax=Polyrhizophydium stewartii TaxID=2732419 RepID=A0ABR4N6Y2_9FUNG